MAKKPGREFSLKVSIASVEHKFACLPLDLLRIGEQALSVCKTMRSDTAAVMSGNRQMMRENTKMRRRLGNPQRRGAA